MPRPELNKRQVEDIYRGLRAMHDLLPILDKAKACGQDCTAWEQEMMYLGGRLQSYLQEFGGMQFDGQLQGS